MLLWVQQINKAVTPTKNEPPQIKKKGTARAVKVKDMFRAFILTLVEAYESNEDTYGYTYWDIVRGIRMANERHAITDGEVDSLC